MPTPNQKQGLLDAVTQIRFAEQLLIAGSRSLSDPADLIQINTEYSHLDSYLSQILHTQTLADDNDFNAAVTALQGQISTLSVDAGAINKILNDVATAGKIAGYIAKAISIIAGL